MNVFFCQRSMHRKRQRETVEFCPESIRPLIPEGLIFTKETEIRNRHLSALGRVKLFLKTLAPLNCRPIRDPKLAQAEVLYTWGVIPLAPKPYVIELDNPYVLTFYNLTWFALMRPILRSLLLNPRCRRIVCISEACKRTLRIELGDRVADKAVVVYPYMADRTDRPRPPAARQDKEERVNFLFVSTEFYLKGGRETLHAFEKLAATHPNAHLTMVTFVPSEIASQYENRPWVTFVPANLDKQDLFRLYYDPADVFLMPTYWDSFGMVFLEAVSFGLPIIATTLYTLPEMVENGRSGLLIEPPFPYYHADGRVAKENWDKDDLILKVQREEYPEVEQGVEAALQRLMIPEERTAMAEATRQLFRTRFAKPIRDQAFLSVFPPLRAHEKTDL
jgi:glycosyltransferase involved in cell wall biosynthesis